MTQDLRARALHVLHSVFGYPEFRGEQADIIDLIAGGGDSALVSLSEGLTSVTTVTALDPADEAAGRGEVTR